MHGVSQRKAEAGAPESMSGKSGRAAWMGVLARADWAELRALAEPILPVEGIELLRGPETGMAMLRAQAGADGTRFHLAELTVTRCSARVTAGPVGHAYVKGRVHAQARVAALCDALMQMPEHRDAVRRAVIEPLLASEAERRAADAAEAGRTRVEFFTLARET